MVSFILLDSEVINIYFLYIAFVFTSTLGILFDRKRDLFLVSILCSNVYFLPCFFGFVKIKYLGQNIYEKVDYRLYIIHVIFVVAMLVFHYFKCGLPESQPSKRIFFDDKYLNMVLNGIWLTMFAVMILIWGDNLLVDKTKLPSGLFGYYATIYNLLLVFATVANYKSKQYKYILLQIPAIIITIIQSHRSYLVFILMAIIINEFVNNNIRIFRFKYVITIILTGIFGFTGKILSTNLRLGLSLKDTITYVLDLGVIVNSVTNSEPFVTQHILNKTITTGFRLGPGYLVRIILKLFLIPPDKATSVKSFYDAFTGTFYPYLNYGLAYNIFAEPYAIAGMAGVVMLIIVFGFVLNYIDNLIRNSDDIVSSLGLSLASIYTFYIFRNSIENIILWTQILAGIFILCYTFQLVKYRLKVYYIKPSS